MRPIAVAVLASASLALIGNHAAAETFTATYRALHKGDKFDITLDDRTTGRMTFYSTSRAAQKVLQGSAIFDGATGGASGWWDGAKGVSRGQGMVKYELGGDSYQTEWNGVCLPITNAEGKGVPHCFGGFVLVTGTGTGKFAGLKGGGSWTARMLPSGEFEEEWKGTFER